MRFQVTNDFTLYKKNHTITIGGSYESFKFENSFNLTGYGFNMFLGDVDIADFKTMYRQVIHYGLVFLPWIRL